ncbi:MAG: peptidylprolyl isomerase [Rhizobiales bacterium]|nr:peptidylprolyl isomerase [Hyphomicrobiales bacterium]
MISLRRSIPAAVVRADERPRRSAIATIAALAIIVLPAMMACSEQSSAPKSSSSSTSDPVVARVNGMDIRESDLTMAEDDLGAELQQLPPDKRREQLISYVTDVMLAAQAAEARKLQDTDAFKQREAFLRRKLLMGLLLQDQARSGVKEEALRKVYDEQIKPMGAAEEVRARHILFRADPKDEKAQADAQARAQAALERIKKGDDFATVASELTEDPSGKENGGDLDYFTKDQMVPEFANIAFQMHPGQVSNPIRTNFGWHIIKLEDRRNRPVPEFDKVRPQIETFLVRRGQTELIGQLREKAKIERLDQKDAPAPAAKK